MGRIDDAIVNLETAIENLEDDNLEDALDEIGIAKGAIQAEIDGEAESEES